MSMTEKSEVSPVACEDIYTSHRRHWLRRGRSCGTSALLDGVTSLCMKEEGQHFIKPLAKPLSDEV